MNNNELKTVELIHPNIKVDDNLFDKSLAGGVIPK